MSSGSIRSEDVWSIEIELIKVRRGEVSNIHERLGEQSPGRRSGESQRNKRNLLLWVAQILFGKTMSTDRVLITGDDKPGVSTWEVKMWKDAVLIQAQMWHTVPFAPLCFFMWLRCGCLKLRPSLPCVTYSRTAIALAFGLNCGHQKLVG